MNQLRRTRFSITVTIAIALAIGISAWQETRKSDGINFATSAVARVSSADEPTPANFKVAFFGDQGLRADSVAVLNLVKSEGARMVLHLGDLDYADNPTAWENQLNNVLTANYPYFSLAGNHDEAKWRGTGGYQQYIENRFKRLGIMWAGDLGVRSTVKYKGLFFVLTAPDVIGSGHDVYIRNQLAADNSIWKIAGWHKNQRLMQVGLKLDEAGWSVYEEARKGGAIIATAHEHSYSRTHLLSNMPDRAVVSTANVLSLAKNQSFAFVSGLGGESIRPQVLSGNWWASIYTSSQDAKSGALFGIFNADGVPNRAKFYFKDVGGKIVDQFEVISGVNPAFNVTTVTSAGYRPGAASECIAAGFGTNLATATQSATTNPLPTTLGGTTVKVRDSAGAERQAPLFFVSPNQVNYQIPPGTASGVATVTITNGRNEGVAGTVQISTVAPGIFTANAGSSGAPAGSVLRVKADGSRVNEPVAEFDLTSGRFLPRPISLGAETDQLFLILYATGVRNRSVLSAVKATIGGANAEVLFAGAQGSLVGVDQINLLLPRTLAGRGEVDVVLTVDSLPANNVRINVH